MTIPLLLALTLILVAAKVGGMAAGQLSQPAVLGKLLAGLALGPSFLNIFGHPYFAATHTLDTVRELGELGVIFLMFTAGLEIRFADLISLGKAAVMVGTLGVIMPIIMGAALVWPFGYSPSQAVFLGIVLAATSVSISAQTLLELGQLRTREGLTLLGAAVVDDVLAIGALSLFLAVVVESGRNLWELSWTIGRMLLFLSGAFFLGVWLLPRAARWATRLPASEALMSFVLISILAFAWLAQVIGGIAAITGAFLVGVALSRSSLKDEIRNGLRALSYAFFIPIFLVSIGLRADIHALYSASIFLTAALFGVAVLSKLLGAGLGAKAGGLTWAESLRVGIGMASRGEVGLIIAAIGIDASLISQDTFTAIVVVIVATTLITPFLLRLAFCRRGTCYA